METPPDPVRFTARGFRVGCGFYEAEARRLAAFREAIVDEKTGPRLQQLVEQLAAEGWEVSGARLKTSPRGYDKTHPRIELLRHKQLFVGRDYGFEDDAINAGLVERVRTDWRSVKPLVDWLGPLAPAAP